MAASGVRWRWRRPFRWHLPESVRRGVRFRVAAVLARPAGRPHSSALLRCAERHGRRKGGSVWLACGTSRPWRAAIAGAAGAPQPGHDRCPRSSGVRFRNERRWSPRLGARPVHLRNPGHVDRGWADFAGTPSMDWAALRRSSPWCPVRLPCRAATAVVGEQRESGRGPHWAPAKGPAGERAGRASCRGADSLGPTWKPQGRGARILWSDQAQQFAFRAETALVRGPNAAPSRTRVDARRNRNRCGHASPARAPGAGGLVCL